MPVAQHQQLAVEHGVEVEAAASRRGSCGRCRRRCARRDASRRAPPRPARGCRPISIPPRNQPAPAPPSRRPPARATASAGGTPARPARRACAPRPSSQANSGSYGALSACQTSSMSATSHAGHLRHRRLGEPGRHADAQRAGQELEQRPAPGDVEPVEPGLQPGPKLAAADQGQLRDDVGEAWRFRPSCETCPPRPCGERGGWGCPQTSARRGCPSPLTPPRKGGGESGEPSHTSAIVSAVSPT